MERRENIREFHENYTTANAIAELMREHPKPIQWAIHRWGLTEGEARGALYAQASRATVDKILRHPNGGWAVHIKIGEKVIGKTLEQHLNTLQGEQENAKHRIEQQAARTRAVAARLAAIRGGLGT